MGGAQDRARRVRGRRGARGEDRGDLHLARQRGLLGARGSGAQSGRRRGVRRPAGAAHDGLEALVESQPDHPDRRPRSHRTNSQSAHLPCARHGVEEHRRPRRRGPGARAARRGLPRSHLLGRALHLPVSHAAGAGTDPVAAALSIETPRDRPPGRTRRGLFRRDVPVAEWQRRKRGDPGRPPEPRFRSLATGCVASPTPRQRGDRVQHLAVLAGHRRS